MVDGEMLKRGSAGYDLPILFLIFVVYCGTSISPTKYLPISSAIVRRSSIGASQL